MKKLDKPDCVSQINEKEFNEFKDMIWNDRNQFINDLLKGHTYIVRNAVDKEKLSTLKKNVHEWGLTTKSSWNDVSDGVPNFHQIDDELKFFKQMKRAHTFHFFKWNEDVFGLFDLFREPINLYRFINGHSASVHKEESLDDKLVNRYQIHHYPPGGGYMSFHSDPDVYLKTIAITYMSEYGSDYRSGGLCLQGQGNKKLEIDSMVSAGDMVFSYPTIKHGCSPIDKEKSLNWTSLKGRWLFLFNTLPINNM